MNRFLTRLAIWASLAVSPALLSAQAAPAIADADPAMWVVRDRDTTIYLFGTFHIMDGQRNWFDDEVRAAFDRSQELVLEADIPSDPAEAAARMQPLVDRYATDPQGRLMSGRLSAEQNQVLSAALRDSGVTPGDIDRMEPWFVNMLMTKALGQHIGASFESGSEAVLRGAAGSEMRFHALETAEDQFRMLDGLPEQGQLAQLKMMLDNWDAIGTQLPRMLNVWKRGDTQGLDRILNAGFRSDPALRRVLLDDRNQAWAEWIAERLGRPGTVFMAVGAGHLVGTNSVQAFLRQRGVHAARVPSGDTWRGYPACRTASDDRCAQRP